MRHDRPVAMAWLRFPRAGELAALVLVLATAAFLIFPNLGDRYLWDDEAETALLARNVLRFGLPVGWDGRDLISQECGIELDDNYVSRRHGWLPVYLIAGAFKLFGTDTAPARLPSALLAWLSIPSLYFLARRLFRDRPTSLLAAVLLALSVPFLLYARQARYYALAMFATIWVVAFFLDTLERRRFAWVGLALALTVFFHTLPPMVAGMAWALAAAFAVVDRRREALGHLTAGVGLALLVNIPWWFAVYGRPWVPPAEAGIDPVVALGLYLETIDLHVFPVLVPLALVAGLLLARGRSAIDLSAPEARRVLIVLVVTVAYLAFIAFYPLRYFRYAVNLLPLFALLMAWTLRRLWRLSPILVALILVLTTVTDALHGWVYGLGARLWSSGPLVRAPLVDYLREVTGRVDGPIEVIVHYLKREARPGERIFITYGDLPLRFYTDLEVRGGQGCEGPPVWPLPEWIVMRGSLRLDSPVREMREDALRTQDYLARVVPWHAYERVTLPVVDTVWENNPEPGVHLFRPPADGRPVVIHRKIRPTGSSARDGS